MFPEDLYYAEDHEWAKIEEGGLVRMGITDYAQKQLGDIVYIELPEIGDTVLQSDPIGIIESVKAVADIFSPISGEVMEVNKVIIESPEIVNESPYEDGWMLVIKVKDKSEIGSLLDSKQYEELVEKSE